MPIASKKRSLLKEALQNKKFEKLEGEAAKIHKAPYKNQKLKDSLIEQWQQETGHVWPVSMRLSKKTGQMKPVRHDIHHIIPQEFGGYHEWWNIHPLEFGKQHQGGVHGAGSVLNKITRDAKQ